MSKPFVLAFDPGTRHTGYALLPQWGRGEPIPKPIFCGATTHTSSNVERRLQKAGVELAKIVRKAQKHGDFVAVYEVPPMHWRKGAPRNGVVSAYMLGQAVGTIRSALLTEGAQRPKRVEIRDWRNAARSLGLIRNDPKGDAVRWIRDRFGLSVSHDCAEACMIGIVVSANMQIARE